MTDPSLATVCVELWHSNGDGTVCLRDFVETLVSLSNNMSQARITHPPPVGAACFGFWVILIGVNIQVQRAFALIYQQLLEFECAANIAGDISHTKFLQLLENKHFASELASAGMDVSMLQTELSTMPSSSVLINRAVLARLVAQCWQGSTHPTPRNSGFGDLGQVRACVPD